MKVDYKTQIVISLVIILLANVICTLLKHWIYHSAGYVVCGLLWIFHPVLPFGAEVSKRTLVWTRLAGGLLVLIGVFTRAYYY